jgi:hypothetical protein
MSAPLRQSVATVTQVTSSATSVQLFAANAASARIIHNASTSRLLVKYGTAASATSYTYAVDPGAHLELPGGVFDNVVHGIWDTANGFAMCTEVSD